MGTLIAMIFICVIVVLLVVLSIFEILFYEKINDYKNDILIRKLVKKYIKCYKKEINNSNVINMQDYVIDLVTSDNLYKEAFYVKKIKKLYSSEKQYLPKP